MKTVDFSETIAASDLNVARCRQLIEFMKLCEYRRSRSFLYHIFSRFCMFCALLGQISGERLQDHWSSGLIYLFRFMESEVELNDIIQEMHVIATVPELYHILVELNTVQSLLQLLTHDNTGIL